jgi:hypothetical protein
MLLAKEMPMATDPTKPGQPVDPLALLLPLLLQSVLSGKQIDPTQLLGSILTGQPVTPAPAAPAPAAPATPATPATPAAPAAPAAQPQPQQMVNSLITLLLPLLYQKITGQSWPGTTTPAAPAQTTTPSVVTNPSVQIGAAGFGLASILQLLGQIAPPFGLSLPAGMTTAPGASPLVGTLATVIPLIVAGVGATGGWGSLIAIGSSLIGAIANAANKQK